MENDEYTVIEYRNPETGKLHDAFYDEDPHYIQRRINELIEQNATEIAIVKNPKRYNLCLLPGTTSTKQIKKI